MSNKAVLAGGSGFIGRAVAGHLRALGWEVVVLTRRPRPRDDGIREVAWDARTAGAWARELDGAAALVNLTGRSINCVHDEANRREILQSRLDSVRALGAAVAGCARPPPVWVQAGAVGYYGTGPEMRTEDSPPGGDALAGICRQWEEEFARACPATVRPVVLRLGVVLGRESGAFPPLARVTRFFLGGAAGSGRQGFSWIHLDDVAGIIARACTDATMRGAYNACAPRPVDNAGFMRALRSALGRPWAPPAPAFAIRLAARFVLRTEPGLILEGLFCRPARLEQAGYRFRHPELAGALADLTGTSA
jgi:uncharacterized protein